METRRPTVLALTILGVLLSLLTAAGWGAAHADFITSTPAPYDIWTVSPTYVGVTVSEAVQPGSETIVVTNLTGARVDSGPTQLSPTDPATFSVQLLGGIGPSVYTVTWAAVSADDGHFTAGTFYFMVAYRDGTLPGKFPQTGTLGVNQPISPVDVALRALDFVGFSITFGGTLLAALVWLPSTTALESRDETRTIEGLRALIRFARYGAVVFGVAAAGLWIEELVLSPPQSAGAALGSLYLASLVARCMLGLALALLLTPAILDSPPLRVANARPPELVLAILVGFLVILLEVAASHSATTSQWWPLGPLADAVHLYGAALWVGGLLAVVRVRRWLREPTPAAFSRNILETFSRFAFLGVFLVVSAGALLALVLVGTVEGLLNTTYGWMVLLKGSLLVPMLALGAWNRRTLRRSRAEGSAREAVRRLAGNVRIEAVFGASVLVLAGLLVTMNPATAPAPLNPTFTLDATNGGLYAIFQVNPWPSGPGGYIFQLVVYYEGNTTPYYQAGNATLSVLLQGGNGSWVTLPFEGPHGNHYFVESSVLDAAGTWDLRAEVRGPQGTPVDLSFQVTLHS